MSSLRFRRRVNMKLSKRIIALTAAALAVCMLLSSCTSQKEETGVANEKNMKISTAADLEGKAVAVQLRSADDEHIVGNKLTDYPKRYSDMNKAVQDLIDKKVAAVVTDKYYAQKLTDGVEGVKPVKKSIGKVEYRFLLNQSDAKLAEKINAQIAALKESEDYQAMIKSEVVDGTSYSIEKDSAKELKKTFTFVTEPGFVPFTYEEDGSANGLFASIADAVAYGCGGELNIKTVDAAFDIDNAADTVKGQKNSFSVVSYQAAEDDESFITTDSFYTSELVMIIRAEENK